MIRVDADALLLKDCSVQTSRLEEALEHLRRQARKKDVLSVKATFRVDETLVMPLEVTERGRILIVELPSGRRRYGLHADGLHQAVADFIRERHRGDAQLLDVYQRLLLEA